MTKLFNTTVLLHTSKTSSCQLLPFPHMFTAWCCCYYCGRGWKHKTQDSYNSGESKLDCVGLQDNEILLPYVCNEVGTCEKVLWVYAMWSLWRDSRNSEFYLIFLDEQVFLGSNTAIAGLWLALYGAWKEFLLMYHHVGSTSQSPQHRAIQLYAF